MDDGLTVFTALPPEGWWRTAPCAWACWLDVTRRRGPVCWHYFIGPIIVGDTQMVSRYIKIMGTWVVVSELILSEMLDLNLHFRLRLVK